MVKVVASAKSATVAEKKLRVNILIVAEGGTYKVQATPS